MTADYVVDLELTRATTLSYDPSKRKAFVRGLKRILAATPNVALTQRTSLVIALVARVCQRA